MVYNLIRPAGSQHSPMYNLPGVHKEVTPLRAILSMMGSIQHELAKWLNELLQPYSDLFSTCVPDSFGFSSFIRNSTGGREQSCIAFLDVLVKQKEESFITTVYQKPTFTGLYMNWNSFITKSYKINLISSPPCIDMFSLQVC